MKMDHHNLNISFVTLSHLEPHLPPIHFPMRLLHTASSHRKLTTSYTTAATASFLFSVHEAMSVEGMRMRALLDL